MLLEILFYAYQIDNMYTTTFFDVKTSLLQTKSHKNDIMP